jgi:hypothetical protein
MWSAGCMSRVAQICEKCELESSWESGPWSLSAPGTATAAETSVAARRRRDGPLLRTRAVDEVMLRQQRVSLPLMGCQISIPTCTSTSSSAQRDGAVCGLKAGMAAWAPGGGVQVLCALGPQRIELRPALSVRRDSCLACVCVPDPSAERVESRLDLACVVMRDVSISARPSGLGAVPAPSTSSGVRRRRPSAARRRSGATWAGAVRCVLVATARRRVRQQRHMPRPRALRPLRRAPRVPPSPRAPRGSNLRSPPRPPLSVPRRASAECPASSLPSSSPLCALSLAVQSPLSAVQPRCLSSARHVVALPHRVRREQDEQGQPRIQEGAQDGRRAERRRGGPPGQPRPGHGAQQEEVRGGRESCAGWQKRRLGRQQRDVRASMRWARTMASGTDAAWQLLQGRWVRNALRAAHGDSTASQTQPRDSAAISSRAGQAISLRLPPCRRLSSRAEALLWWSDARGRADNAPPAAGLSLWLLRVSCARACEACPARGPAAVDSAHTAHTSPSRDERTLHRVTRRLSKRPRSREKRRLLRA